MAVRVVTESVVLKCTLDHLFGHGLGTITGNIDVVPRLDYVASALVGLAAEFTPFFANAARFYNEIWPFCSERFRSENTPQFVLRTNEKNRHWFVLLDHFFAFFFVSHNYTFRIIHTCSICFMFGFISEMTGPNVFVLRVKLSSNSRSLLVEGVRWPSYTTIL